MSAESMNEIGDIRRELSGIITELENVAFDLKSHCAGIGTERCTRALDDVIRQYRSVIKKLNEIGNELSQASSQGSIGARSGGGGW